MSEKSHVTVEQKKCEVCTKDFDSGAVLLDKRMRKTFEHFTVTGWGLCPDCKKLFDDGYMAIVAVDESRSEKKPDGTISVSGAYRLGDVVHVRFRLFDAVVTIPRGNLHMMFCDLKVVELFAKLQQESDAEADVTDDPEDRTIPGDLEN